MDDVRTLSGLEMDHAFRSTGPHAVRRLPGARGPRVVILPEARIRSDGLVYRRGGQHFLLPWRRIGGAHAAEVGEPEGVQTVVFDLTLVGRPEERCRFDADPGDDACAVGRALEQALGRARCTASLRAVALEGYATRSYPDLESLDRDIPSELLRTA